MNGSFPVLETLLSKCDNTCRTCRGRPRRPRGRCCIASGRPDDKAPIAGADRVEHHRHCFQGNQRFHGRPTASPGSALMKPLIGRPLHKFRRRGRSVSGFTPTGTVLKACLSAVRPKTFSERPRFCLSRGLPEISRFSRMLSLSVRGFPRPTNARVGVSKRERDGLIASDRSGCRATSSRCPPASPAWLRYRSARNGKRFGFLPGSANWNVAALVFDSEILHL